MGNDVFSNGREIVCKAADGKALCAFPDVCFTPPQTPATPPGVPLPYPNTAFAKDTAKGSKKVKISGKPVLLKNKSYFKKSTGDEAGSAPKKGIVNSKTKGKVYFASWSMDVKFEKKNVARHLDMVTHNHASQIGNESIPWIYADTMNIELSKECMDEQKNFVDSCKNKIKYQKGNSGPINIKGTKKSMCEDPCREARECALTPYALGCCDNEDGDKRTGHHLMPNSMLRTGREDDPKKNVDGLNKKDPAYTTSNGPCCCATGSRQYPSKKTGEHTEHSLMHKKQREKFEEIMVDNDFDLTFENAKKASAEAHTEVFKDEEGNPKCKANCLEEQLQIFFDRVTPEEGTSGIKVKQVNGSSSKTYRPGAM